ncbi:uncharacterized protein with FMN-binding domain [Marisediminicola sp. UYEF4]|uniref:FMN-binding protein n=1 Tax=Marisediminicola sp. UYEF4 TaxID=1756384 RepID=UPI003399ECAE
MRRRAIVASLMSSTAVLIFGWQLGTSGATVPTYSPGAASDSSATTPPGAAGSGAAEVFAGNVVATRFGTVQVQITVASGQLTDVTALKLTDAGNQSVRISARAAPILRSEALTAQSAEVDVVTGATYTTDGYTSSLQSALDQAGM